jgi:Uma2 family endonuclease
VLSDSTEEYDGGEKFAHYMKIASLQQYVLVSQKTRKIEVLRRPERGHWQRDEARTGEASQILGASIKVDDVYRMPAA